MSAQILHHKRKQGCKTIAGGQHRRGCHLQAVGYGGGAAKPVQHRHPARQQHTHQPRIHQSTPWARQRKVTHQQPIDANSPPSYLCGKAIGTTIRLRHLRPGPREGVRRQQKHTPVQSAINSKPGPPQKTEMTHGKHESNNNHGFGDHLKHIISQHLEGKRT
jgi:hypothetical protein